LYGADLITKGPWVDVRAYGAVADDNTAGVANTNAFQAAANYLKPLGGGVIYAPGNYRLASKISIYSGIRLVGTSMEGTVISGTFAGDIISIESEDGILDTAGCWVENLSIDGVDKTNGGYGITVVSTSDSGWTTRQSGTRNVRFKNLERGLYLHGSQDFSVNNSQFRFNKYGVWFLSNDSESGGNSLQQIGFNECDWRYNEYAISGEQVGTGSKPYGWVFYKCHIESNEYGAILGANSANQWTFISCKFEGNNNEAVKISGAELFRFVYCYFNDNARVSGTQQVYISSGSEPSAIYGGHSFDSCVFYTITGTAKDIYIGYTYYVRISGCLFYHADSIEVVNSFVETVSSYDSILVNPTVGVLKTISAWITGADYPYKDIVLIPGKRGSNKEIYIYSVSIQVTEAFVNTSGTTGTISVGIEHSPAYFTQAESVLSTGVKEPTFNNKGYTSTNNEFIRATIDTNGTLDNTTGKALIFITFTEVPPQP
jgi:hypothetical protein